MIKVWGRASSSNVQALMWVVPETVLSSMGALFRVSRSHHTGKTDSGLHETSMRELQATRHWGSTLDPVQSSAANNEYSQS
jgi:hypothetical protein